MDLGGLASTGFAESLLVPVLGLVCDAVAASLFVVAVLMRGFVLDGAGSWLPLAGLGTLVPTLAVVLLVRIREKKLVI